MATALAAVMPAGAAFAQATPAPAEATAAQAEAPAGAPPAPAVAPPGRTVNLTGPLVSGGQVYGDILIQIAPDGAVAFESQSLRAQVGPLLNDAGRQRLDSLINGRPYVAESEYRANGFDLHFDPTRIEVDLAQLSGDVRRTQVLGGALPTEPRNYLPTVPPAKFSGYLNISTDIDYDESQRTRTPDLFLYGAVRYGSFVVEYDTAFSDQFNDNYRFYRRGVRGVFDQPDHYRRFSVGDLRLDTLPILRTPFIGGVAVQRSRQIFEPYAVVSRLGGRQIFIDTPSNVDVLINGAPYQTFQLSPGSYDLSQLPIRTGSNNIQLRIRDAAGRQQLINFDYFFDPLDLAKGDVEYTAGVGAIARNFSLQPNYTNDAAFVGMYRRGISDTLVLGAATQISGDVQVLAGQVGVVPQVVPGSFQLQGAVSHADVDGTGFAGRASYRWRDGDINRQRQVSIAIDYQSAHYRNVGFISAPGLSQFNISASYSQALNPKLTIVTGGNYTMRGGGNSDYVNVFTDFVYQANDRFRISVGGEYGNDDLYGANWGVRLSLTVLFNNRTRASVDYRSRTETLTANVSRGADSYVNSFGYDLSVESNGGDDAAVNGSLTYIGNRFTANAFVQTRGDGFGHITDDQRLRLQLGTSISFADGVFGIGRPIADSFAIVRPHSSIDDKNVIVGRALEGNRYEAASGPLGAGVLPRLTSYNAQDIQYDVDDLPPGYDIGAGVVHVRPPYRSGYRITVGNERFVSALGDLVSDGHPAALVSGTIASTDDAGFTQQPFFSNSAGRFSVVGLAPGKTYEVTLSNGRHFTIAVPADTSGLYRMGTVNIP